MDLATPLSKLPGIGVSTIQKLEKLQLFTIKDLLYHFPFRYDDYSKVSKIAEVKMDDKVTLSGDVWQVLNTRTKFGKVVTKAILNDGSGSIELVWFNQPYLAKSIKSGDSLNVAGTVGRFGPKLSITAPDWEKVLDNSLLETSITSKLETRSEKTIPKSLHTGRLVPVYPETAGLNSKWLRNQIDKALTAAASSIEEFLPPDIKNSMLSQQEALQKIHFPTGWADVHKARERLGFDELFFIQLITTQARMLWNKRTVIKPWTTDNILLEQFFTKLPFDLTSAQNRVLSEITQDLQKTSPMNRLVQGEVGSGKTVVAAAACVLAYQNGFQSLLMAPTEILAIQHYNNIKNLLEPLGISVGIYTGSRKEIGISKGNRLEATGDSIKTVLADPHHRLEATGDSTKTELADPTAYSLMPIIVGTHALISEGFKPEKVGLVVIDEQHRFGVEQRALLRQKGTTPHLLTMTATPIPRTIALTMYGDLDISVIDQLPKNRPVIKTYVVPEKKRLDAYKFIEKKVLTGDQVYIVTPLIEETESMITTKAAKVEFEKLQKVFPKQKLGLLHGKMKSREKEDVLEQFRQQKLHILVSTSVVEVGVDIPNATIMLIEGANRFGLAQLHQLRGRVGRGIKESFCLLFNENEQEEENTRLKYMEKTFDGLKLAELDLKTRGSGTIFGTSQHGRIDLKIAKFTDLELIQKSKAAALKLLQTDLYLDKYPALKRKLPSLASEVMPD